MRGQRIDSLVAPLLLKAEDEEADERVSGVFGHGELPVESETILSIKPSCPLFVQPMRQRL